jgi:hypothetical protein
MSNTDVLRESEADLLPPGFVQGQVFTLSVGEYHALAEVDGWHPASREAIEICQSETYGAPKPGQKRKMASDALKLILLKSQGLISNGRIFVTSPEMYTWFHQSGSWLSAACRANKIHVELKRHERKSMRKRIRNVMRKAQREKR